MRRHKRAPAIILPASQPRVSPKAVSRHLLVLQRLEALNDRSPAKVLGLPHDDFEQELHRVTSRFALKELYSMLMGADSLAADGDEGGAGEHTRLAALAADCQLGHLHAGAAIASVVLRTSMRRHIQELAVCVGLLHEGGRRRVSHRDGDAEFATALHAQGDRLHPLASSRRAQRGWCARVGRGSRRRRPWAVDLPWQVLDGEFAVNVREVEVDATVVHRVHEIHRARGAPREFRSRSRVMQPPLS